MRKTLLALIASTALTAPVPAQSAPDPNKPLPTAVNSNMRTVAYDPNARVHIIGNLKRVTIITYRHDEEVIRVLIGDGNPTGGDEDRQTWEQPDPDETKGKSLLNVLHLFPRKVGYTGITVVTRSGRGLRTYQYAAEVRDLRDVPACRGRVICDDPEATYGLSYTYPSDEAAERAARAKADADARRQKWVEEAPIRQARWEAQRSTAMAARLAQAPLMPGACDNPFYEGEANAEGHRRIMPASVYDNGQETFFVYRAGRETPNFYTLASDGKSETPVLPVQRGPELLAIPVVTDQIRLRLGDAVVHAYRRRALPSECVSQTGTNDRSVARTLRRAAAHSRPRT